MKKLLTVLCLAVLVGSCAKKSTPAKSETPSTNVGGAGNSGNYGNTGGNNNAANTAAPTPTKNVEDAKTLPPSATAPKAEDAVLIEGQKTFNAKCGRCHGLKVTSDYTDLRWVQIMQVMAMKANLSETEKANVLAYVRANCKKG